MTNKEKYFDKIVEMAVESRVFGVNKNGEVLPCINIDCDKECIFAGGNCDDELVKRWLEQEYTEPKVFTTAEKTLINLLDNVKYVARDADGKINFFNRKPDKRGCIWEDYLSDYHSIARIEKLTSLPFKSIKWEDEEAVSREEILGGNDNEDIVL